MIKFILISLFLGVTTLFSGAAYVLTQADRYTPAPTSSTQVENIEPTVSVIQSSPVANADPIISCTMMAECGGKTYQITKSQCQQSTCCQIGNSWYIYPNNDSCSADQNKYAQTPSSVSLPANNTYAWPTFAPLPTYSPVDTSTSDALKKMQDLGSQLITPQPINGSIIIAPPTETTPTVPWGFGN